MAEGWIDAVARAKVNLRLRIFPRTEDGYHPLETIFCRIDLADQVRVRLWPEPHRVWIRVTGPESAPQGPENLAARAATLFAEKAGVVGGIEIELEKRVRPGSGLGGGSSDAAAVLRTLERVLDLPGGREEMARLALELGADVPFFAADVPLAVAGGRGERLEAGPDLELRPMLVALPDITVSTADAYAAWDEEFARSGVTDAGPGSPSLNDLETWDGIRSLAVNDFEPVMFERYPELRVIRDRLDESGAIVALLSGSGSALFAVYESEAEREEAASVLGGEIEGVRLVSARGPV